MANNKVTLADGTVLIDITDTSAEAADVISGKVFYTKAGVRSVGTMVPASPLDSYPVGAIYASTSSTSPASLFGGSWTRITGQFLLGATDGGSSGASQAAGNTGGAATVTLTTANLAAHTHGSKTLTGYAWIRRYGTGGGTGIAISGSGIVSTGTATWTGSHSNINASGTSLSNPTVDQVNVTATHEHTSVGSGTAHNNMPPYVSVYIWKRVS